MKIPLQTVSGLPVRKEIRSHDIFMPPSRCRGKTPAATSGRSQPAGSGPDISSGISAVFFPPFPAICGNDRPAGQTGNRSSCATVPGLFPTYCRHPADETVVSSLPAKNVDERIHAVRLSPVRSGTCSFAYFHYNIFRRSSHRSKK